MNFKKGEKILTGCTILFVFKMIGGIAHCAGGIFNGIAHIFHAIGNLGY